MSSTHLMRAETSWQKSSQKSWSRASRLVFQLLVIVVHFFLTQIISRLRPLKESSTLSVSLYSLLISLLLVWDDQFLRFLASSAPFYSLMKLVGVLLGCRYWLYWWVSVHVRRSLYYALLASGWTHYLQTGCLTTVEQFGSVVSY